MFSVPRRLIFSRLVFAALTSVETLVVKVSKTPSEQSGSTFTTTLVGSSIRLLKP